jgi:hypothetical protein
VLDVLPAPLFGDLLGDPLLVHAPVDDGPRDLSWVLALQEERLGLGAEEAEDLGEQGERDATLVFFVLFCQWGAFRDGRGCGGPEFLFDCERTTDDGRDGRSNHGEERRDVPCGPRAMVLDGRSFPDQREPRRNLEVVQFVISTSSM